MDKTIGTCSECGGPVTVPTVWFATVPPTPQCRNCHATAADHGPTIKMMPRKVMTLDSMVRIARD